MGHFLLFKTRFGSDITLSLEFVVDLKFLLLCVYENSILSALCKRAIRVDGEEGVWQGWCRVRIY